MTGLNRIHLVYVVVGIIITFVLSLLYIGNLQQKENLNRFATIHSHLEIVHAANELSSYVKRAEGHMLMYLILHNQSDRDKFYSRHKKLKEIHLLLSNKLARNKFHSIVDDIDTNAKGLLYQGNILLGMIDKGESLSTKSNELITFHNFSSEIRRQGVHLVNQLTKELGVYNNISANSSHNYMLYLIALKIFIIILLLFILIPAKKFFDTQEKAEKMKNQLLQAQKMEAVGTLVGGIAHDFNNTLSAIQANLYLAKFKASEKNVLNAKLGNIEKLTARAAEMVQQLLTFARKDMLNIHLLPLTSLIRDEFKLIKNILPKNIDYNTDLCDEELIIHGDATQIQQLLINLLNNARDAVRHSNQPKIVCTLKSFNVNTAFQDKHPKIKNKRFAHLIVEDNGCGISENELAQIFVPFFTTKAVGEGTGLGLAMVYGSIQTHRGIIEVESKEDKGTAFHIYLPLSKNSELFVTKSEELILPGKGETILLADDEEDILEATSEVLNSLGYKVLLAANGKEIVELFNINADEVSLVITDIVMPKMSGIDAAKKIRLINSEIPIIFATGYDKKRPAHSSEEIENSISISKPFSIGQLSQLIRKAID